MCRIDANGKLMRSPDERDIVAYLPGIGVERGVALGSTAERESGWIGSADANRQQHVVRRVAVDVDAHLRRREEIRTGAMDRRSIEGEPDRVERRRANHEVLAGGEALSQVIPAANPCDEQILVGGVEAVRRRSELLGPDVTPKERVLVVDLVID